MTEKVKKEIEKFLSHETLSVTSIPSIVVHSMEIAENFTGLKGAQKKKVVEDVIISYVKTHMSGSNEALKTFVEDGLSGLIDVVSMSTKGNLDINKIISTGCFGACRKA